jgi:hypothetical protein
MLKLHERVARDGVLCAGEVERDRARAACYQDVTAFERASVHGDGVGIGEACHAVKSIYALLGQAFLLPQRHRIGRASLKGDQLFPVDVQFSPDAVPMHPARKIDRLGTANQHLLGIAAA